MRNELVQLIELEDEEARNTVEEVEREDGLSEEMDEEDYYEEDLVVQGRVLQLLLLAEKIASIQFPNSVRMYEYQITELWQGLLQMQPPDLHTIDFGFWDIPEPFFNNLLLVLPNIEVLQTTCLDCNDQDLDKIADSLTKLRSVLIFVSCVICFKSRTGGLP
jgi:hypothetical protein